MSRRRSTLFLVYNLGAEMVYVLAQRLNSQNVPLKQAASAIDKIISMLTDWDLLMILIRPQEMFSHEKVKNIIEDIAQCSTMRLDPVSMDKLWDLITMVLKWQVTLSPTSNEVLNLSETHLFEIEKYVSNVETLEKLNRIQSCLSMLKEGLGADELKHLHSDLMSWLKEFNVKVSLLIKLELQTPDGKFLKTPNENNKTVLSNLGKNIYLSQENDKLAISIKEKRQREMNCLQNDLLGSVDNQGNAFKFTALKTRENNNVFDKIDVKREESNLQEIFNEFHINDNDNNEYDYD
ncbi:protein OSCP1 [Onthophagus taurus]|uniref:protein OSCP1 n=1 Tax=Onthophagus taurus TaxID=166361 RepID=UPI0039BDC326